MDAERPAVVFLMGPTACGKTEIAANLSRNMDVELISVDASQVYRDINIGTAKPDSEFLSKYPHHLIDIRGIDQPFSAADFVAECTSLIGAIHARGRIPLLVGGTMFYYNALEHGLSTLPAADPGLRAEIENERRTRGLSALHQDLRAIDPDLARRIRPQDSQRIQRAHEIHRLSGDPPSRLMAQNDAIGLTNPIIKITLFAGDRKQLHQRIERRFEAMLEAGLIEEVRALVSRSDFSLAFPAMRSVGYRQVLEFLENGVSYEQMKTSGVAATRQLAKRQLTWLRNQSNLVWFDIDNAGCIDAILHFLAAHPQLEPRR